MAPARAPQKAIVAASLAAILVVIRYKRALLPTGSARRTWATNSGHWRSSYGRRTAICLPPISPHLNAPSRSSVRPLPQHGRNHKSAEQRRLRHQASGWPSPDAKASCPDGEAGRLKGLPSAKPRERLRPDLETSYGTPVIGAMIYGP